MKYLIEGETLKCIANAIREKTGKADALYPTEFANEISEITGGGSGIPGAQFWEFTLLDGTVVVKEVVST